MNTKQKEYNVLKVNDTHYLVQVTWDRNGTKGVILTEDIKKAMRFEKVDYELSEKLGGSVKRIRETLTYEEVE